jgi:indolepyruvate ferredoxin oxidoreductase alpha subunit
MERRLLMGNEAIALGAVRAGVRVCSGYPGTPSTEILETVAREKPDGVYYEWSVNEKAAMEVAAGAAISGARSLVTMKQVGLNVASDPLMSLNYVGVKAGMVVVVADDPGPISSQTEQDARHYGRFAKICVFDPSSPEEAYTMAADAFALSESIGRPVILRPTTRVCHSYASVDMLPPLPQAAPEGFTKDDGKWAIFPRLSYANKIETEAALSELAAGDRMGEGNLLVRLGREGSGSGGRRRYGIASGGVSWQYVREALRRISERAEASSADIPEYDILKIGTDPLPERMCEDFLHGVDEALVIEELDPFIEDELTRIAGRQHMDVDIRGKRSGDIPVAGECSAAIAESAIATFMGMDTAQHIRACADVSGRPPLPVRPPVLCAGCPHRASFFAVKEAMKGRAATYSGDIGCYTLGNAAPLDMVDTCLCMGAGVTQAQGIARAELSGGGVHFAFIGDSTFLHTGVPGLMNAAWNGADVVVCILDNATTAMTGGQPHPGMGRRLDGTPARRIDIRAVASAVGADSVRVVDAFDVAACMEAVSGAADEDGVRVVIFEGPCINLVPKNNSLVVSDECTGCSLCVAKLGCPALSMRGGRAEVDGTLCTGCGLCAGICPVGALTGGVI